MYKVLKYTLILILLFSVSFSSPNAQGSYKIRFAVIADTHINSEAPDNPNYFKLLFHSADIFKIVIDEINSINADSDKTNDIDFVLFAGDNCDGSKIAYYKLLSEIVGSLKVPFYMVCGDWDYALDFSPSTVNKYYNCPYSNLRELVLFDDSGVPGLRKYDYSLDITTNDGDVVHLIGIDNVLHFNGNRGSYEFQQLKWIEDDLKRNDSKRTIVLQHCPVLTPYSPNIDKKPSEVEWIPYELGTELMGSLPSNEFIKNVPWRKDRAADNSGKFLELVMKYKVPLILTADLHLNKKIPYPPDRPVSLITINPPLVSYPSAWTIYEMDSKSISWEVRRVEKYAVMSEEYDRRSLESFNLKFDKLTGDKHQYDIEKTLALSYGEPFDWSGTFVFSP